MNAVTKIKLIQEATQIIDFSDMEELAALQKQDTVDLQEDIEEESIENVKYERDEYKKKIEELQAQLKKNAHQEIPLLNSLEEELQRLGKRRSSFEEEELLMRHQQEINSFKAKIAELNQINVELIKKNTHLETQVESYKQDASKSEDYNVQQAKNKRLEEELQEKSEIIHTQTKAIQELNEQVKRLNTKINDLEAEK